MNLKDLMRKSLSYQLTMLKQVMREPKRTNPSKICLRDSLSGEAQRNHLKRLQIQALTRD